MANGSTARTSTTSSNLINTQQHNEIWSDHPGGAMALWCDGSASLLAAAMELPVLRSICTRAGNDSTNGQ